MTAQFAGPRRIRTDGSNAFAHHTMQARVPAILEDALRENPDYDRVIVGRVRELAEGLRTGAVFPELRAGLPHQALWRRALAERPGEGWLTTDWFFAENYAYRLLADYADFWQSGRDPFRPHKLREYASPAFERAFLTTLRLLDEPEERASRLLSAVLFGNRIDLSFAASRERGTAADEEDLLCDDRRPAIEAMKARAGAVHLVVDNAGTELAGDLVFADFALRELGAPVVLHVKVHPAFVSDAIARDVLEFIGVAEGGSASGVGSGASALHDSLWQRWGASALALRARLRTAQERGLLRLAPHAFWNGPDALRDLPADLEQTFRAARIVLLKGDAHYRRALNDAIWPTDTPFAQVTARFPAPLVALRTLKSDPVVGLSTRVVETLERDDPSWRVNGKRGVISLGGTGAIDREA